MSKVLFGATFLVFSALAYVNCAVASFMFFGFLALGFKQGFDPVTYSLLIVFGTLVFLELCEAWLYDKSLKSVKPHLLTVATSAVWLIVAFGLFYPLFWKSSLFESYYFLFLAVAILLFVANAMNLGINLFLLSKKNRERVLKFAERSVSKQD